MKKILISLILFIAFFVPFTSQAAESSSTDYYLKGDKDSKFSVVTYTDFECPFCRNFHETLKNLIEKNKYEDISFSYRMFPLRQIHVNALPAAVAFVCLNKNSDVNKNIDFSSVIFDQFNSGQIESLDLKDITKEAGVDEIEFIACVESAETEKMILADLESYTNGIAKNNNFGTPYTVVSYGSKNIIIPGSQPYETVSEQIDKFIKDNRPTLSSSEKLELVGKFFGTQSQTYKLLKVLIDLKRI